MRQKESFTDILRQALFDGVIEPGQPLTEEGLSQSFGVSRTPVREALIRLEGEGLVTIIKNKGAFVREVTPTDVVEIFQLRILMEGYAARVCLEYIDRESLQALYEQLRALISVEGMEETKNRLGHQLHEMITANTPNARFRNLVSILYGQFVRVRDLALLVPDRTERSLEQHLKIAEELLKGNGPGAERAMKKHLESTMLEIIAPSNIHIFNRHLPDSRPVLPELI